MAVDVWLWGALALHRRKAVLNDALSAMPVAELPDGPAVIIAFGDEFQRDANFSSTLVTWSKTPGHLAVLCPPFLNQPCALPVPWTPQRRTYQAKGGEGLAALLAPEVSHQLDGRLQVAPLPGATWTDLTIATAYYRAHPASGVFAVTSLPLWSVRVLDRPEALRVWIEDQYALAGQSMARKADPEPAVFRPGSKHFVMLMHLLSGSFADGEAAIQQLAMSSIFQISTDDARQALLELTNHGLISGMRVSDAGVGALRLSPYAAYAAALQRMTT